MKRDDGSATVWVLLAIMVIWATAGVASAVASGLAVRHRAAAAADAAALAGAIDGGLTPTSACFAARRAAGANGARLVRCVSADGVVTVRTTVDPPAWLAWVAPISGTARAGPAGFHQEP